MTGVAIVVLLSGLLAWFTYWKLERIGARAWPAALARGIAGVAFGLLLLDLTCAGRSSPTASPLVLLDGSLSMAAAGGKWSAALDSARLWGEVRLFGDQRPTRDSLPSFGRSDLGPALRAALASDRRVIVVSDGEISDPVELGPEDLAGVRVRVFPRDSAGGLAIGRVVGPVRVSAGDTIRIEAEVLSFGAVRDPARIEARLDQRVLARRAVRVGADGAAMVGFALSSAGLAGDALFTLAIVGAGDAEPRDDARLLLVRVTPTPGIVMVASPSDWDGRFLFRTLRDVADLPVRGYARLDGTRWRSMETLRPVQGADVAEAVRRADVLVVKGVAAELERGTRARGLWRWPSGEEGETVIPGEWYATAPAASPVAGAFVGLPVDSFPPLLQITPIEPAAGDWVGLSVQLSRRGADRPVLIGHASGGRRQVTTAADGLWRWAFRGGSGEQSYRALVAHTLSWLLSATDSTADRARPLQPVVPNGRPVVFEWSGAGPPTPIGVAIAGDGGASRDTLRFDGAGRALLWLPPGRYRYQLDGDGTGLLAVDRWSDEWLPRPVVLNDHTPPAAPARDLTNARTWIWLFGVVILALAGEWLARRRLGLR